MQATRPYFLQTTYAFKKGPLKENQPSVQPEQLDGIDTAKDEDNEFSYTPKVKRTYQKEDSAYSFENSDGNSDNSLSAFDEISYFENQRNLSDLVNIVFENEQK